MPASGSNLDAAEREFKAAELSLKSAETRLKSLGKPSGTGSPRIYVKLEDEESIGHSVVSSKGFTTAQAMAQQAKWGRNEIPEERESKWTMFFKQFAGSMPMMIEIAALLAAVLGDWLDFWIIFGLLMTNGMLGFIEEMNAQGAVDALRDGIVRKLPVKRDGVFTPLDVTEIVPGDVVFLRGGNIIPADGLWVEGDELSVDQAALTGESLPVAVPREDADGEPGSGKKMWSGAIIKVGEAQMFVTETGLNTMMGEAAKSIQESSGHTMGLLESKIVLSGRVLIFLTLIAVACLLVYEVGFHGKKLADVLEGCLCLVIASVPVALPMVMKVTLSVGAKELASHGAIVTHLTALEDIASMKMLCSDKTGTLTTAQMTVYETKAKTWNGYTSRQVMEFAAIASNAANKDDAIDRAVYQAYAAMLNTSNVDDAAQKLALKFRTDKYAGFNPIIKRTVADVTDLKTGKKLRVAKGIVSKILNTGADGGIEWTVDAFETIEPQVKDADAAFGKQGYKTIAIAVGEGDGPMQYAGTLPIMDPPRADTKTTIAAIRGEGVGVKMITGDHVNIARELARQIDLGDGIEPNTKLWPASKARDDMILHTDGFAQVLPKDKHEVVAVLQSEHGMIVGMTGDGVNDAPALAKAQVGIAVEGATDAAQSAADIILTRPGLSPIHVAIQASRRIFKRLKAYVIYRICCTVQVVFFLCFISFVYDDTFEPLYIILLALFHDLTIVTIAYDRQTPSPRPETPTVTALVITSYTCGIVLALSSLMLYIHGAKFLDADKFTTDFKYKESLMFLQITNSSALLIFSARATGLWFLSCPDIKLFISVVISQAIVNFAMLYPEYALNIVDEVDTADIMTVWIWNFSWLFAVDLAKIFILYAQEAFIQSKIPGRSRSGGWWADFIPFLLGNVKTEAPTPKEVSVSAKYGRGAMAETSMSHGIRHRLDSVSKTNKYKGVAKFGTSAAQTVAALGANNRMPTDESYGES